jgi:hypothetical protein
MLPVENRAVLNVKKAVASPGNLAKKGIEYTFVTVSCIFLKKSLVWCPDVT